MARIPLKDVDKIFHLVAPHVGINALKVLMSWLFDSSEYLVTQHQIAERLGLTKQRVSEAFNELERYRILEKIGEIPYIGMKKKSTKIYALSITVSAEIGCCTTDSWAESDRQYLESLRGRDKFDILLLAAPTKAVFTPDEGKEELLRRWAGTARPAR